MYLPFSVRLKSQTLTIFPMVEDKNTIVIRRKVKIGLTATGVSESPVNGAITDEANTKITNKISAPIEPPAPPAKSFSKKEAKEILAGPSSVSGAGVCVTSMFIFDFGYCHFAIALSGLVVSTRFARAYVLNSTIKQHNQQYSDGHKNIGHIKYRPLPH